MADDASPRFQSDKEDDPAKKTKDAANKSSLDAIAKWDAMGVAVDAKTLEGRKANRGFTIAMGKTSAAEDAGVVRKDKRAQTLPSASTRRGDHILTGESMEALSKMNQVLQARYRRGSVTVAVSIIPPEEFKKCWEEDTLGHVHGTMTEGQAHGDEREREFHVIKELPGNPANNLPPIISCHKGSKGFRDTTPNQDNFSITYFKNGWAMACAFDGHGPFGHIVSTRAVQSVPYYVAKSAYFPDQIDQAMIEGFEKSQKELVADALENNWDVQASGSTAVACMWKDNVVWSANAGDSRCVIGSEVDRKVLFETEDHKPNTPAEQERIEASGGEVRTQTYPDGWVNHRIFVKGEDYPGLCMARTLGDESVKAHGVIATPECKKTEIDLSVGNSPFILLASDGVWEFLDSDFVIKAVAKKIKSDGPEKTVQKLQREAKKRWRQEEGDYCDDITSVLIQLGPRS